MTISSAEFEAVQKISSEKRYKYFINKISVTNKIYYLKDDEVLTFHYLGGDCCPLWADPKFAEAAMAHLETPELKPHAISVREFVDEFVKPPYDGLWVAIMPNADGEGYIVPFEMFRDNLIDGVLLDLLEEPPDLAALGPDAPVEKQVGTIFRRNMKANPKGKLPGR